MTGSPRIVPELNPSDLARSLTFYCDIIGFSVRYARPEDLFAYLELDGAELMLEQATGPGRRFAPEPAPGTFGLGLNLQIEVPDVDAVHARAMAASLPLVLPLEEKWYRVGDREAGNRQFVIADPDGFLIRPFTALAR